jgi:hypothetical protein
MRSLCIKGNLLANRFIVFVALGLSGAAQAQVSPALLSPQWNPALRVALEQSGLVSDKLKAVPAFAWTIEYDRPFSKPKVSTETYTPTTLNGVIHSDIKVLNAKPGAAPKADNTASYSIRGLERFQANDDALSFQFLGFTFPPSVNAKFNLNIEFEKQKIAQSCVVGAPAAASRWHAGISGNALPLVCTGKAKYLGASVNLISTVIYFESLGMFFNEIEDIKSAFGTFALRKRITDFKITKP